MTATRVLAVSFIVVLIALVVTSLGWLHASLELDQLRRQYVELQQAQRDWPMVERTGTVMMPEDLD